MKLFFIIFFVKLAAGLGEINLLPGNYSTCEDQCSISYPPHTYPQGEEALSCQRGCRLYAISELLTEDAPLNTDAADATDVITAVTLCYESCVEAYNETSAMTAACKEGCNKQDAVKKREKQDHPTEEGSDATPMHLLRPFMQVRKIAAEMLGSIQVIRSSIITYFLSDDRSVVAVEGPTNIIVTLDESVKDQPSDKLPGVEEFLSRQSSQMDISGDDSEPEIVQTTTVRVGFPPYLFVLSVAIVIVFLLYLMCSICSARKKDVKAAQVSVPIPLSALPVKLVRPEDLTKLSLLDEDENMAPALPVKVKLPDSTV